MAEQDEHKLEIMSFGNIRVQFFKCVHHEIYPCSMFCILISNFNDNIYHDHVKCSFLMLNFSDQREQEFKSFNEASLIEGCVCYFDMIFLSLHTTPQTFSLKYYV